MNSEGAMYRCRVKLQNKPNFTYIGHVYSLQKFCFNLILYLVTWIVCMVITKFPNSRISKT